MVKLFFKANGHKLALLTVSLFLIALLSGSAYTSLFVLVFTALVHVVLRIFLAKGWHTSKARVVPALSLVLLFLVLEHQGYIAVLSATNAANPQTLSILLGFAFYFLQVLGITISVMRCEIPLPSFLDFVVATTYLPKFLSGPVESVAFLQRMKSFRFRWDNDAVNRGAVFLLSGLIFKYLIAGHIGKLVDVAEIASPLRILRSTVAFEFQVYFDFAGYSLMAYGASLMLGSPVTLNFNHPFAAKDVPEFWRRWHIGLGRWFHTYVYEPWRHLVPHPFWRKALLPIIVFLLSALWHGQTLNFLIWGLFHGLSFAGFVWIAAKCSVPGFVARLHLVVTLIVGRFFFMDPDFTRLKMKIDSFLRPAAWQADFIALREITAEIFSILSVQGNVAVAAGMAIILYEAFWHERRPMRPAYPFFSRDLVFAAGVAAFLLLFPLFPQYGFVYGR